MKLVLNKRPKSPVLLEGFPGFGMVGAIAAEYLIQNLDTEQIGKILIEDMPAMVAVHEKKLLEPFAIHYSKKHNLLILHAVAVQPGIEWQLSDAIFQLVAQLGIPEVVSLEGIGTNAESENIFYYATDEKKAKKLAAGKHKPLDEGVILGITAALLLKRNSTPVTCIFAETHSQLPDSKAAAKLVEAVDRYLNLKVDTKPLLMMAEVFEKKLKGILEQANTAKSENERKQLSYVG